MQTPQAKGHSPQHASPHCRWTAYKSGGSHAPIMWDNSLERITEIRKMRNLWSQFYYYHKGYKSGTTNEEIQRVRSERVGSTRASVHVCASLACGICRLYTHMCAYMYMCVHMYAHAYVHIYPIIGSWHSIEALCSPLASPQPIPRHGVWNGNRGSQDDGRGLPSRGLKH